MGWFDQTSNSTGSLCARLSDDAAKVQGYDIGGVDVCNMLLFKVQGATGARIGSLLQGSTLDLSLY